MPVTTFTWTTPSSGSWTDGDAGISAEFFAAFTRDVTIEVWVANDPMPYRCTRTPRHGEAHRERKPMRARTLLLAMAALGCLGGTRLVMADAVDGTYTGERVLMQGSPSACVAKDAVSITIHGDQLIFTNSRTKNYTISFHPHPDGSFVQLSADIG